jgi:hypothetical protein
MIEKKAIGRPNFKPTHEQRKNVEVLAGYGMTLGDICALVRNPGNGKPISTDTLKKYFRNELKRGKPLIDAQVTAFLMSSIIGRPMAEGVKPLTDQKSRAHIALQYAKAKLGWGDKVENVHVGPIQHRQDVMIRINNEFDRLAERLNGRANSDADKS